MVKVKIKVNSDLKIDFQALLIRSGLDISSVMRGFIKYYNSGRLEFNNGKNLYGRKVSMLLFKVDSDSWVYFNKKCKRSGTNETDILINCIKSVLARNS